LPRHRGRYDRQRAARFNPTLVRFCLREREYYYLPTKRFNPTLVRFCRVAARELALARRCFNPTLVRFCPRWAQFARCGRLRTFQSHLGSILPRTCRSTMRAQSLVSIPPWFDFARSREGVLNEQASVSIPPWFDFAPYLSLYDARAELGFNPTLVRFCQITARCYQITK